MKETINDLIDNLGELINDNPSNDYTKIYNTGEKLLEEIASCTEYDDQEIISKIKHYLKNDDYIIKTLLHTLLISAFHKSESYIDFLKYQLYESDEVNIKTRIFIMHQTESLGFIYPQLVTNESKELSWKLHIGINKNYAEYMNYDFTPYSIDECDKDFVLLITDQYLSNQHGPTKIVNRVASVLAGKMGKKVLIINVAETLPTTGIIPMYGMRIGNYRDYYNEKSYVEVDDLKIPFFQCDNCMPDEEITKMLLKLTIDMKPHYAIAVGADAVTINLISRIVPTLAIPLSLDITYTDALYQTMSRDLELSDIELLKSVGKSEACILKQQANYYLHDDGVKHYRSEYGISEDAFLAVIVGARLESDLTDAFWDIISRIDYAKFDLLLIGPVGDEYLNRIYKVHNRLIGKVHAIGLVNSVLGYYDFCDIYINPWRRGGGTSSAEAMYKGLPVITPNYGDVAGVVGNEFHIASIEELPSKVMEYIDDRTYYNEQSEIAREKASKLFGGVEQWIEVINEFERRVRDNEKES